MKPLQKLLKRRRLIVDPGFQMSLVVRGVGLCVLLLLAIALGLLWPLVGTPGESADPILSLDSATVLLYMHHRLWWIVAACLLLALVVSVRVSHRIAGPLVRFKRQLEALGDGCLPAPLHTRRGDYLKHEVELLNRTVARLDEHIEAVRAAHAALAENLARARVAGGDLETRQAVAEAITAAEVLRTRLAVFRRLPPTEVLPGAAVVRESVVEAVPI
jgi:hypothetical protein